MSFAREKRKKGEGLDPLSLIINTNVGWVADMAGRYNEAVARARPHVELDPTTDKRIDGSRSAYFWPWSI